MSNGPCILKHRSTGLTDALNVSGRTQQKKFVGKKWHLVHSCCKRSSSVMNLHSNLCFDGQISGVRQSSFLSFSTYLQNGQNILWLTWLESWLLSMILSSHLDSWSKIQLLYTNYNTLTTIKKWWLFVPIYVVQSQGTRTTKVHHLWLLAWSLLEEWILLDQHCR